MQMYSKYHSLSTTFQKNGDEAVVAMLAGFQQSIAPQAILNVHVGPCGMQEG